MVGSGTHFWAYVNDKMFVHGHAKELGAGRAGFNIDGNGLILMDKIQLQAIQ
jgi:hypothetical protein